MRKNQIELRIDRYGDQAPDGIHESIYIYSDSNNVYEALSGAFQLAMNKFGNPAVAKHVLDSEDDLK